MTPIVLPSFGVRVCHSASERPLAKAARARAPCSRRVARALARALAACAGVAVGVDVFVMRVIYQGMKDVASPDPVILRGGAKMARSGHSSIRDSAASAPWDGARGRAAR